MKTFSPSPILLACLSGALLLLPHSSEAQLYKGKVTLRGTLVQRGQITDMSVKLKGDPLTASNGDQIRMNAGGLYSRKSPVATGKYRGRLKRITNEYGDVERKKQKNRIRVSKRRIKFKDGKIRLKKPLRVNGPGRYRLRGQGMFKVRT
ncbi:MAG: hypothetical protein MI807_24550 [Verrucomicrobiales bacterium]|nr:hypothetical protein [Verrucomicrobiales bacterium]